MTNFLFSFSSAGYIIAPYREDIGMQQTFSCPKCGTHNTIGEQACHSCSTNLQYSCPHCSTSINPKFKTCPECGAILSWPTQRQKKPLHPGKKASIQNSTDKANKAQEEIHEEQKTGRRKTIYLFTISVSLIGILFLVGFAISMLLQKSSPTVPPDTSLTSASELPPPSLEGTEVTVDELLNAYQVDRKAAEAQYKGKILLITGTVDSIGINLVSIPFVKLAGNGVEAWRVQCIFDKDYESELAEVKRGERITIQGKCDDYLPPDVTMKNCVLSVES